MCNMTVEEIFGLLGSDGAIESLLVSGTVAAGACSQIEVRIEHSGNGSTSTPKMVAPNSAGVWRASFDASASEFDPRSFRCGIIDSGDIGATAVCTTTANCAHSRNFKDLPCGTEAPPLPAPPVVVCPSTSVSPPLIADECIDGRRRVVVSGQVTPAPGTTISARLVLREANGTPVSDLGSAANRTSAFTLGGEATALSLAPGNYEARLEITQPNYCGANVETFEVPPCEGRPNIPPPPHRQPDIPAPAPAEPPSGFINPCWVWFWINIGLFIAAAALVIITTCLIEASVWAALASAGSLGALAPIWAGLSAAVQALVIVTVVLLFASLVSFALWLLLCAFGSMRAIVCDVLSLLLTILATLELMALVIAGFFFLMQWWGCLGGAVFDMVWFGFLMAVTRLAQLIAGCVPWWWSLQGMSGVRGRTR